MNYISLSGQLELYFIMPGTVNEVIKNYQSLIGLPMMPPYYALGLYVGSSAYNSL